MAVLALLQAFDVDSTTIEKVRVQLTPVKAETVQFVALEAPTQIVIPEAECTLTSKVATRTPLGDPYTDVLTWDYMGSAKLEKQDGNAGFRAVPFPRPEVFSATTTAKVAHAQTFRLTYMDGVTCLATTI